MLFKPIIQTETKLCLKTKIFRINLKVFFLYSYFVIVYLIVGKNVLKCFETLLLSVNRCCLKHVNLIFMEKTYLNAYMTDKPLTERNYYHLNFFIVLESLILKRNIKGPTDTKSKKSAFVAIKLSVYIYFVF